ncbi:hypothetical protein B0O80DRAFT_436811 [Mortierella sp. GBAus27b]|nr:hypothetical protein B0O80DRAFT_436811 [Mortierella sp. GBAus27b]
MCLNVQLVVAWFSRAVSRGVSEDHTILEATRHLPDALWPELRVFDEGGCRRCPDLSRVLDPLCKRLSHSRNRFAIPLRPHGGYDSECSLGCPAGGVEGAVER